MPITITPAFPGTLFGPGVPFSISSDLVGPVSSTTQFSVTAFAASDMLPNDEIATQRSPFVQQPLQSQSVFQTPSHSWQPFVASAVVAEAAPVFVRGQLFDTSGNVDTPAAIQLTWTNAMLGSQALLLQQTAPTGGLTPQQDATLTNIQAAVNAGLRTATGLVLETPIGSILAHPARQLLNFHTGPGRLTGRGVLNPLAIPGIGTIAYGLMLSSAVVPPGFGLRDGQIQEYRERIGQFVTLFQTQSGAVSYPAEVFDYFFTSYAWLWRDPFPAQILYDITTGCGVDAFWIVA